MTPTRTLITLLLASGAAATAVAPAAAMEVRLSLAGDGALQVVDTVGEPDVLAVSSEGGRLRLGGPDFRLAPGVPCTPVVGAPDRGVLCDRVGPALDIDLGGDQDFLGVDRGVDFPVRAVGGDSDDELRGGSGDDVLDGGTGDDAVRGNAGRDLLLGGDGHDVLNAQDEVRDAAPRCATSDRSARLDFPDRVLVDPLDPDPVRCDDVTRGSMFDRQPLEIADRRLRVARGAVLLSVRCRPRVTCRGSAALRRPGAGIVGRAKFRLGARERATLRFRVGPRELRRIRRGGASVVDVLEAGEREELRSRTALPARS